MENDPERKERHGQHESQVQQDRVIGQFLGHSIEPP
jgi:hypothetical protein